MKEFQLEESKGHIVTFYEYGNPEGEVILNFHGGPGSGSKPHHAERFDLSKYRVILFDQRGCGKSTPLGNLENNTTEDLLADAERIRERLGIDKWFVAGSSWGSTLALLYAIKHPDRVRGLLVSAIFLADRDSMDWSMSSPKGVARLMPDVWAKRMEFFKKFDIRLDTQNEDLLRAMKDANPETLKEIVAGIRNWMDNLCAPQLDIKYEKASDMDEAKIASTQIFLHYEANHEFLPDNYILDNIDVIKNIPTIIIHGRYDILCPIEKAQVLHTHLPNSEFVIIPSSGHLLSAEGEMIRRLAHDRFLEKQSVA